MPSDRKPRIFIDGYNLSLEQGTGVATYARNLSFSLRDLGAEVGVLYGTKASTLGRHALLREIAFFDPGMPSGNAFTEALRRYTRPLRSAFGEVATQVPITGQVIRHTFRSRLPHFDHIWNVRGLFEAQRVHFRLYRTRLAVQFRRPPDLMHWTYPLALFARGARNVYTIHDLVPLRLPYTTLDNKRSYFRLARLIGRRADHIITVSEASKRDIVNLLGVPSEQVSNTYQAVEIPARYANKPVADVRAELEGTFGLPYKGYFLFFGAIEPKKNVGRLLEAYLGSGVQDPLVLVGKQAWKSEQELRLLFGNDHVRYLLTRDGVTETRFRVRHVDYAPFPLLVSLIRGAKAVLFPSLYEGFGLPALEAMLLGTPVMTSNTSSMPEVVGDAALKVDPYDVRAMVEAIRALDADADLRGRLADLGPKQASLFAPERYQERIRDAYARVGLRLGEGALRGDGDRDG
ncbi:glycosyltransferase family 4 protein [Roseomonas alkaliterrae]|uniref:Glycosyltransferase involved in cell wall biosynthesis n=1 Tax=Neoroseomonas alkaliterrae TaxID=1452450 RepID=A0A840Y5B3_9PROT|nr:glycosyltransferase family 1 protein [Neoroseomonas alkaliterrae]MBB5691151.1 glycosyltransferase involved in cell wall biosynthesis [Neoroseomonas alkaliterrae]MBR0675489.1 glycosyltransferase family 4 protein [Neoroseomonas alkaliterrae]